MELSLLICVSVCQWLYASSVPPSSIKTSLPTLLLLSFTARLLLLVSNHRIDCHCLFFLFFAFSFTSTHSHSFHYPFFLSSNGPPVGVSNHSPPRSSPWFRVFCVQPRCLFCPYHYSTPLSHLIVGLRFRAFISEIIFLFIYLFALFTLVKFQVVTDWI